MQTQAKAQLRLATLDDVESLAALEAEVWGAGGASADALAARIANVPKGNILAETSDGICGLTSFCFIDYATYEADGRCTWNELCDYGTASNHDPKAKDLFGINLGVAGGAPKDTSIRLLSEVVRSGVGAGLRRGVLGARMPGYHKHCDTMTAEEYAAAERRPGVPLDPELRYYYNFGMKPVKLVENYFEDPESKDWGMLVEMKVPWPARIVGPLVARLPIDLAAVLGRLS